VSHDPLRAEEAPPASAPAVSELTWTMPLCTSRMKRKAVAMSRVKIEAERPNLTSLASSTASSRSATGMTARTGPKTSSWASRMVGAMLPRTVGGTK